ncbi:MAG: hypothetical protein P4L92_20360 [Rudaea sp.]|nr:hypothetical protein [Rudaea sp.]
MQWYVYLITISATTVLGWFAFELLGRRIRAFLELRRKIVRQMLILGNISLPKPREMAVTSREIREYDESVRNVREAQRTFRNLGFRLLAFSENEPATRNALGLLGVNLVAAGSDLIKLSEAYPRPDTDRAGLQNQIRAALGAAEAAPAAPCQRPQRQNDIQYWTKSIYARDIRLSSNSRRRMEGRAFSPRVLS